MSEQNNNKNELVELEKHIVGSLNYILLNSEETKELRELLLAEGIDEDCIKKYAMGYFPEDEKWLASFAFNKGISPQLLYQTGLFQNVSNPMICKYVQTVVIPLEKDDKTIIFAPIVYPSRLFEDETEEETKEYDTYTVKIEEGKTEDDFQV